MSEDGLTLAVPSKGRLEEETRRVFGEVRLPIARPGGARSYSGTIKGHPEINVRFYPAGEIARELIVGAIDLGVTGSDLIFEASEHGHENVVLVKPLNFGQADVVVAIPDAWIDVVNMTDLADVASDFRIRHGRWLRVATKYVHLTRKFFSDYGIAEYRIVESSGATEAAPASGTADLIVDITSSGATLQANALRILEDGVVMKSQAHLIVSRTAVWSPLKKAQLEAFLAQIGDIAPGLSTEL